jgi:hypothetical protein
MTRMRTAHIAGVERDREQALSELERERLEDMLRRLRVERADVRAAMAFALDHAASAAEVSETLVAALTLDETPAHLKVSRCAALVHGAAFAGCDLGCARAGFVLICGSRVMHS